LVARAEADTMGYLEFVDLLLGEEVGLREGRRFRARSDYPRCPTTKASMRSTSPSNPTSTAARSATWPR
jgi:hypothetical protein